ncbi:MAG: hypothetical protein L3J76_04715 [Candidatus Hydrothermae bacterium]|nr:hypothetical protein [Candidatus Hydrothermae bacterium]
MSTRILSSSLLALVVGCTAPPPPGPSSSVDSSASLVVVYEGVADTFCADSVKFKVTGQDGWGVLESFGCGLHKRQAVQIGALKADLQKGILTVWLRDAEG